MSRRPDTQPDTKVVAASAAAIARLLIRMVLPNLTPARLLDSSLSGTFISCEPFSCQEAAAPPERERRELWYFRNRCCAETSTKAMLSGAGMVNAFERRG